MTAVDAAPGMVARAALAAPEADVRPAALLRLPFADEQFDAVGGNFVLNHVGQPRDALREMRRVTRPGGWTAVTIWTVPAAPGQALLGRAVQAAGVTRPVHLPALAPEDDFPRIQQGLAALPSEAGLKEVICDTLSWGHRTTLEEWRSGPAAEVATIGQIVTSQSPSVIAEIRTPGSVEGLGSTHPHAHGADAGLGELPESAQAPVTCQVMVQVEVAVSRWYSPG
ncbi:hypothetical protein GCM10014715_65780 [Streptomyces spiralis]|uniref:Methyltransferase type 11 domain-containing protein n=1 Tax=Streptomyces spiralis TaxID=66376 RepID=A0A919E1I1_9ACTN|nr:hypothetical protein GCM10014715_65780 [Streptomyces spiralis]